MSSVHRFTGFLKCPCVTLLSKSRDDDNDEQQTKFN